MSLLRPVSLLAALLTLAGCAGTGSTECCISNTGSSELSSASFVVTTLNLAHGKRTSRMMKVSDEKIVKNLDLAAGLLRQIDADFAALQEADEAAWLTGGLDHVEHLSDKTGWPNYVHTLEADSWAQKYGPAVLAQHRIANSSLVEPDRSLPTINKSFVAATFDWVRDGVALPLTVISLQFDPLDAEERDRQLKSLVGYAQQITGPYIVAGDFGTDWADEESIVRAVADELNLQAYQPDSTELSTYGEDRRLDWILLSSGLTFVSYASRPEVVSDHLAVVAEVTYRKDL